MSDNASKEQWAAVDRYFANGLIGPDAALASALANSADAGLPSINVSPAQGKLLHLLAKIHGAKKILEIGTLGGYSTIWLARALPAGGKLITLEYEPKHAEVAMKNLAGAGLADRVHVRVGPAIDTLPTLVNEGPFDFVFIDADKVSTPEYFEWAMKLTRVGSVIIVDNVVRDGAIGDSMSADKSVLAIRRFIDLLAKEKRATATTIQTVGSKGYDGFTIVLVTS